MSAEEALQLAEDEGLTLVTSRQGTTGYKGVYHPSSSRSYHRFYAQYWDKSKRITVQLGGFVTKEEAALVYARHAHRVGGDEGAKELAAALKGNRTVHEFYLNSATRPLASPCMQTLTPSTPPQRAHGACADLTRARSRPHFALARNPPPPTSPLTLLGPK